MNLGHRFLLLMLALFPLAAQAIDGASVCDSIRAAGYVDASHECLRHTNGNEFAPGALAVCQEMVERKHVGTALVCMTMIANKVYRVDEVNACNYYNSMNDPASVIACMDRSGWELPVQY